jgi:hypothetical protein
MADTPVNVRGLCLACRKAARMADPVRVRRLTDREGQRLQQVWILSGRVAVPARSALSQISPEPDHVTTPAASRLAENGRGGVATRALDDHLR